MRSATHPRFSSQKLILKWCYHLLKFIILGSVTNSWDSDTSFEKQLLERKFGMCRTSIGLLLFF